MPESIAVPRRAYHFCQVQVHPGVTLIQVSIEGFSVFRLHQLSLARHANRNLLVSEPPPAASPASPIFSSRTMGCPCVTLSSDKGNCAAILVSSSPSFPTSLSSSARVRKPARCVRCIHAFPFTIHVHFLHPFVSLLLPSQARVRSQTSAHTPSRTDPVHRRFLVSGRGFGFVPFKASLSFRSDPPF